jgi:hypothetical protein
MSDNANGVNCERARLAVKDIHSIKEGEWAAFLLHLNTCSSCHTNITPEERQNARREAVLLFC